MQIEQKQPLYRIEGFVDLWVDACLRSAEGELKFISFYGRDSSAMQFISAMELGNKADAKGITRFKLVNALGQSQLVDVGSVDRLGKHSCRLPRQNLFGPLSHLWVYDKSLQVVDKANRIGWVVSRSPELRGGVTMETQAWQMIKHLSPIALLDSWRDPLMDWCRDKEAMTELGSTLYPRIGDVRAMRISISDHFIRFVSQCVRDRMLMA